MIEKKNPLKQGLKHTVFIMFDSEPQIEKKNPLKQGLKHPLTSSGGGAVDN